MKNNSTVCFSKKQVKRSAILLVIVVSVFGYLLYTIFKNRKEKMSVVDTTSSMSNEQLQQRYKQLQDALYNVELNEQRCQTELYETKKLIRNSGVGESALLNKIYNPLVSPNRYYPGGRLNEPNVVSYDEYQQIGFIYKDTERYPLIGRHKYQGRTDRWEYYVIDETRNRLKIPFTSRNDEELYDGDSISISGLGDNFTVKIYDYETFRYNPNI